MNNEELEDLMYRAGLTAQGCWDSMDQYDREAIMDFAKLVAAAEREKVAAWMRSKSYATGHGDTIEDLLKELEWQVAEREREACAKVCEKEQFELTQDVAGKNGLQHFDAGCRSCAEMIRARGE